jgi:hypothetical protein
MEREQPSSIPTLKWLGELQIDCRSWRHLKPVRRRRGFHLQFPTPIPVAILELQFN